MLGLFVKKLVVVIYCLTGRVDLGVEIKNVTALTHVLILTWLYTGSLHKSFTTSDKLYIIFKPMFFYSSVGKIQINQFLGKSDPIQTHNS